jgi:hypothetical protein
MLSVRPGQSGCSNEGRPPRSAAAAASWRGATPSRIHTAQGTPGLCLSQGAGPVGQQRGTALWDTLSAGSAFATLPRLVWMAPATRTGFSPCACRRVCARRKARYSHRHAGKEPPHHHARRVCAQRALSRRQPGQRCVGRSALSAGAVAAARPLHGHDGGVPRVSSPPSMRWAPPTRRRPGPGCCVLRICRHLAHRAPDAAGTAPVA